MQSAFFSLRARAWEPLAGALIAAAEIRGRFYRRAEASRLESPVTAAVGWALVFGCVVYPFPESKWPGVFTLLPVLGAAMVILVKQEGAASRVLGSPIVQRVGDWSYSIYLWHWPVWVFALSWLSLRGYGIDVTGKTLMVVVSVGLGAASFRYVEQPFRIRRDLWTPRRLMVGSGLVFSAHLGFTLLALLTIGFPSRLPAYLLPAEMARRTDTPRDECFRNQNSSKRAGETYCTFGAASAAGIPSAILWGDSFANQYLEPISSAAFAAGIHGQIATQSACRAFVDDPVRNSRDSPACREFNRATLDFVLSGAQPSIVVLGSNWGDAGEISELVDRLISSGKTVILIGPLLNVGYDVPQRWVEQQLRTGGMIGEWKVNADPHLTMASLRKHVAQVLYRHKSNPRLIAADPQSVLCEADDCYLVRNGQANFRDTAHISNVNAMQYRGIFDAAFRSALQIRAQSRSRN
jgi:hypothetical protein